MTTSSMPSDRAVIDQGVEQGDQRFAAFEAEAFLALAV